MQIEVGQRAKRDHRLDVKCGRLREVQGLEIAGFRFLPAPVLAIGIPKRAIQSIAQLNIAFWQIAKRLERKGLRRSQIVLIAGDNTAQRCHLGQPRAHLLALCAHALLDLIHITETSLKLASVEQDARLGEAEHRMSRAPRVLGARRATAPRS